ncbi:MAG: UTP--glucose-1-phosphate uridylyltransferase GalU [Acidimicrobiales bacterium]|nr:UTP--glucose-1-phosphate uridylyltransferase GalU [Acidimicrobiales bacterium]
MRESPAVNATSPVRKAVIPAAGFGTRFLPATKAQAKEMLPIVDKPVIQYIVEEAVAAGIDDILIITGFTKRSIEDHFDRQFELEQALAESGKDAQLAEVVDLADLADIHFVRQGERLGLGHAISVARKHVGDNPFVVMLGDEFMSPRADLLAKMIRTHAQYGRSVLALQEVEPEEISRYGCAKPERISDGLVQILDIVEKPQVSEAPSNLAVMGRYVFTPEIFDKLEHVEPGVGGEIQLTDAIAMLLADQAVYGVTFDDGRYDTGTIPAYLETIVDLALERDDLRDDFAAYLRSALDRHGFA